MKAAVPRVMTARSSLAIGDGSQRERKGIV